MSHPRISLAVSVGNELLAADDVHRRLGWPVSFIEGFLAPEG